MTDFITRFAPSPTGYLHLGHGFAAIKASRAAKSANGTFLLRIEDIDQTRCKAAYEEAIYEDLNWLGLEWPSPVRRQSDQLDVYLDALTQMRARGLVYRCFKTRREVSEEIARAPHLSPTGPDGPVYIGKALSPDDEDRNLAAGAPFAWRLSLEAAKAALGDRFEALSFVVEDIEKPHTTRKLKATPQIFGDIIIARKDAGTSYHLASVVDDARDGITHVIRGEDLAAAAHIHRLLQAVLGLPTPIYRHHPLIGDENGKRLAKRDQSLTIRAMRERGMTREDVIDAAARAPRIKI